LLYISCSFTLVVCGGKNISPNFTDSQEPEPHAKKQEPEPLGKKSVAGAAKKKSQEPELLKNYPAPQP